MAIAIAIAAAFSVAGDAAPATTPVIKRPVWITLGTQGGPLANPRRGQPSNILSGAVGNYLIDVGDGTVMRMAAAQIPLESIQAVFLSHLHFDHAAGLGGFLGLRYQTNVRSPLTIYGPVGTRRLVEGLLASMEPGAEIGTGFSGAPVIPPARNLGVVELADGQRVEQPGLVVRAAENTHYSFPPGSAEAARNQSLSYRFETGGRTIAYTGDTGPSRKVEALAEGVDLLVSEMIDLPNTESYIRRQAPHLPPVVVADIFHHLADHHLSPEQAGALAGAAHAKKLVLTHLSGVVDGADARRAYLRQIREHYAGPVAFANDLDRF